MTVGLLETGGVDLSAAARVLIATWESVAAMPRPDLSTSYAAMERLWWALTGTDDTDSALALARYLAAAPDDVHAYIPPL